MSVFSNITQLMPASFDFNLKTKVKTMKSILSTITLIFITQTVQSQSLNDLSWLAGYWVGTSGTVTMEELWTEPKAGIMLGVHRDVNHEGKKSFEYLRIEESANGISLIPSPRGKESVAFSLAEYEDGFAAFENLDHDFPQRIKYIRDENTLHVTIEDESGENSISWSWSLTEFNPNQ